MYDLVNLNIFSTRYFSIPENSLMYILGYSYIMWKQFDPFEFCFFSFHMLDGSGALFAPGLVILRY